MGIKSFSTDHESRREIRAKEISTLWYPRPNKRNYILKDELGKGRICRLYKEGYSLRELADWFLTSYETVRTILRDANIKRKPFHGRWKPQIGREIIASGYILVYVGVGFPGAPKNGWMFKHRLLMQKHLGRVLLAWEVVHHKDRNRQNNDISNLKVISRIDHPTCIACPYYQYYVEKTGNIHLTTEF